jgi:hypothetical protein
VEQQYNGCEMAQNDKYSCRNRNFGSKRTRQWRRLFRPALTGLGAHIGTNMREAQFWVLQEERQTHISTCDPRGLLIKYDLAKSMEADFGEKERIKSRWRSSRK